MLKLKAVSPARRWGGALALATLCVGVSFAAWAAQPAEPRFQAAAGPIPPPAQSRPAGAFTVEADEAMIMDAEHRAVWRGNVTVVQGGDRLMSDVLDVYSPGPLQRLVASGHVLYVSARRTARADQAVFQASSRTLTLTGDVVALQGQREFRGRKLIIDLAK